MLARLANSLDLAGWGTEYTQTIEAYEYMAGMWLVGEDMPQETNRVTLHPTEKDQFGMPIPNVHFDDHVNDIAMRNHAYKRGAMVYDAIGATRIIRTPPGPSTHNLGTCRLSRAAGRWRLQQVGSNSRYQKLIHFGR